jgi:Cu2+-exporting ATPase
VPEVPTTCFHCGESLAGRRLAWARLHDSDVAVCCQGCKAAAEMIALCGLEEFYRFRSAPSVKPQEPSAEWLLYDDPVLLDGLTRVEPNGRSAVLLIDGLTCAACSWLIGRSLQQIDGVVHASVNTATGRARVVWDGRKVAFSRLLRLIADLGYRPHIATVDAAYEQARAERRAILKRLAASGLGMMQVMMFAVAMYAGDMQGMDQTIRDYLRAVSMLVATPVMLYGGWPFFAGAYNAWRVRSITMDVPVALGLALAYGASVFNTWRHAGDVYFDSVTMFIFFLTVARFVEMTARHQSTSVTDSLSRTLPATAHRLNRRGDEESNGEDSVSDVLVAELGIGDRLWVRAGEIVPADGDLIHGCTRIDESMLTGEPLPVARGPGERLAAGTLNVAAPVQMRVAATGASTVLAGIVALLSRAQAERPRIAREADRRSSRFLARVLCGAVLVCGVWLIIDPSRAFAATLAVLVVACPCAFSLATLVAVAAANAALARRGVLVSHQDAIEGLAKVTRVVFDKTGTLTQGTVSVTGCTLAGALSETDCLGIAAALEAASEHPIARAFGRLQSAARPANDVQVVPGAGLQGTVGGARYRIGTPAFVLGGLPGAAANGPLHDDGAIVLGTDGGELARFTVGDSPRPDSARAVAALRSLGLGVEILSGDARGAVELVAEHCGISRFAARQSPGDKLRRMQALTAQGEFVAMVGDGMNDAPVLGGAGVSIAMGRGSALTLATADLILVGDSLAALPAAVALARRAKSIMRQNLLWAAGYNLTAMPLAALGWVPPWLAAIGMSLSSIVVVLNSLRLMRADAPTGRPRLPAVPTPPMLAKSRLEGSLP